MEATTSETALTSQTQELGKAPCASSNIDSFSPGNGKVQSFPTNIHEKERVGDWAKAKLRWIRYGPLIFSWSKRHGFLNERPSPEIKLERESPSKVK